MDGYRIMGPPAALLPSHPDLHRVLEAELARDLVGQQRCLGHQQPNQVVGEQIDPQLFHGHLGCLAAQMLHTERRLDVAQVQFHVPTLAIQGLKYGLGSVLGAQKGGDHDLSTRLELPHLQRGRLGGIRIVGAHPENFGFPERIGAEGLSLVPQKLLDRFFLGVIGRLFQVPGRAAS